jgi:hypothetical protein
MEGGPRSTRPKHSHIAHDVEGQCPLSHPVALPELELILRYPEVKEPVALRKLTPDRAYAVSSS